MIVTYMIVTYLGITLGNCYYNINLHCAICVDYIGIAVHITIRNLPDGYTCSLITTNQAG